jgi:hypothetical protein
MVNKVTIVLGINVERPNEKEISHGTRLHKTSSQQLNF